MSAEDLSGQVVTHYRILKRLGEGGMGVVYQAEDTRLKRIVALKFIRRDAGSAARDDARFQREAEASAALNHPHIATIHEIGEADGRTFIAMEFVDGPNLRELLRPGPLDLAQGLELAVQMAGALQCAHDKGIIHRDIKTDNIMVTREGAAKIMDFGLARSEEHQSGTLTAGVVGTVPYMSPEQACGEPFDHRTDIWSLGVVLYEMFTGRHPFRAANDRAIVTAIITGKCEPLTKARPGLPLELERIIGLCLEKRPEKRYRKAGDLKADLDRLNKAVAHRTLTSDGTTLPGPGLAFTLKKYRRRILTGLAAAAFAALFLVRPVRVTVGDWLGIRSAQPVKKSLAVLPFDVNGGDDRDRAFAAGLVEMLTSKLTQAERFQENFRVVPAAVVREFGPGGVAKVWKSLGINQVITGGIQFNESRIYLILHLNDTREVRILKSVELNAPRKGLGALPESVAGAAVGLLGLEISPEMHLAWKEKGTCNSDAEPLVIQAKGYLQRYENPDNVDIAISLLRRVVELTDARCAAAYAALGEAYWYKYDHTHDESLLGLVQAAADQALALNKNLAEVHVTLGLLHRFKRKKMEALEEFERASSLNPRSEDAFREKGSVLEELNRFDEAEASYQRAIELRPEAWSGYQYLGVFYLGRGRYGEAESNFRRITELTPDNLQGYNLLGALYLQTGRGAEAIPMFERSLAIKPTSDVCSNLGTLYFFANRYPEAAAMYEKAIALGNNRSTIWGNLGDACRFVPGAEAKTRQAYETAAHMSREDLVLDPDDGDSHMRLARYLVFLGDKDGAVQEIERARVLLADNPYVLEIAVQVYELTERRDKALDALGRLAESASLKLIDVNPDLAKLRKDPRYRSIVERKK